MPPENAALRIRLSTALRSRPGTNVSHMVRPTEHRSLICVNRPCQKQHVFGKYKKSMALEATQALPRSEVTQLCRAVLGGCEHLLHSRRENTRNYKSFMTTSTPGYSGRI